IIRPVSGTCYRVLPGKSQLLQIIAVFQTQAPSAGLYNETDSAGGVKRAIGITIVKNIQIINK
ncbi:hypothetical protein, partial [Leclercia sp.]|uniref:hypothetical protein n=1 Tax=Leclercia sp. TaxID=1898428 RepID=UPI00289EC0C7